MKLYANYVATTSRAVLAFCEHTGVDVDLAEVDLMNGEHHQPEFASLNPNRLIPVLDDDGFIVTEASAILRYLAEKAHSDLYPLDPQDRARVNELIAWFEANFYKDFGFQFVYPQLFPHHSRGTEEANRATIEFGRDQACARLTVLDRHYLAEGRKFLVRDRLTIADFFGASILSLGDLVHCSFADYPNVSGWYEAVAEIDAWKRVNGPFRGFAASLAGKNFVGLS